MYTFMTALIYNIIVVAFVAKVGVFVVDISTLVLWLPCSLTLL
jgi:hypothetical protein